MLVLSSLVFLVWLGSREGFKQMIKGSDLRWKHKIHTEKKKRTWGSGIKKFLWSWNMRSLREKGEWTGNHVSFQKKKEENAVDTDGIYEIFIGYTYQNTEF